MWFREADEVRVMRAFGANDLRNIRRDSIMLTFALAPFLAVVVLRITVPLASEYLSGRYGLDLTPYYPLLLSLFMLGLPLAFGGLAGFMILDERDDDTLTALRVTPASMSGYAAYRISTAVLVSFLYTLDCISLTGLASLALLPDLAPAALLAGLFSPVIALALVALANNKVEGLAISKAFGAFMLGPLATYFVGPNWQLLFGVLPTYWPAKAVGVAAEGGNYWPYLLAGTVYNLLLASLFLCRFRKRLYIKRG